MPQKVIDVFFRHKFLVLLPLAVLFVLGLALSLSQQTTEYSSSARVWTQRTALISSRLGGQGSAFTTPADHQARVIRDLMTLDSFRLSVASKVDGLAGLPPGAQIEAVGRGTAVFPSGVNVLMVRHVSEDPVLARDIVGAVIETYSDTFQESVISEASAAETFYEERLASAAAKLDEARAALAGYQGVEVPNLTAAAVSEDPQAAILLADVREAQTEYDSVLSRLEEIHLERDAALEGRDLSFQVMDEPVAPAAPLGTPMKDLLMFPILGMLMGISASGLVLFGLTRLDDSLRLPAEIRRAGVPVLAVVPELGRKRQRSWPDHFVRVVVANTRGLLG